MEKPILKDQFWHDGRGPELGKVHLLTSTLKAVEYKNPDWSTGNDQKHLVFEGSQAYLFTPEEVYAYDDDVNWGGIDDAAIVDLGKSDWLHSFNTCHLDRCSHYKIMFYDEILDVICELIEPKNGPYVGN